MSASEDDSPAAAPYRSFKPRDRTLSICTHCRKGLREIFQTDSLKLESDAEVETQAKEHVKNEVICQLEREERNLDEEGGLVSHDDDDDFPEEVYAPYADGESDQRCQYVLRPYKDGGAITIYSNLRDAKRNATYLPHGGRIARVYGRPSLAEVIRGVVDCAAFCRHQVDMLPRVGGGVGLVSALPESREELEYADLRRRLEEEYRRQLSTGKPVGPLPPLPPGYRPLGAFDGASRGNPGVAAWGCCLGDWALSVRTPPFRELRYRICSDARGYIGMGVGNNEAEYLGVINLLRLAQTRGLTHLIVLGDSEVVIKQLRGEIAVRRRRLVDLKREAEEAAGKMVVTYHWIRRCYNSVADALANAAIQTMTGSVRHFSADSEYFFYLPPSEI